MAKKLKVTKLCLLGIVTDVTMMNCTNLSQPYQRLCRLYLGYYKRTYDDDNIVFRQDDIYVRQFMRYKRGIHRLMNAFNECGVRSYSVVMSRQIDRMLRRRYRATQIQNQRRSMRWRTPYVPIEPGTPTFDITFWIAAESAYDLMRATELCKNTMRLALSRLVYNIEVGQLSLKNVCKYAFKRDRLAERYVDDTSASHFLKLVNCW